MIPNFTMPEDMTEQVTIRMDPEIVSDSAIIMHLTGYIDTYNSSFFAKQMSAILAAGYISVILECRGLNYMSSTGVGAFTNILKEVGSKGVVVLAEPQQKILEVFQLLGFSSFFKAFDSIDEAKKFVLSPRDRVDTSFFPMVLTCPVCNKKLKTEKAGTFRCPECKTGLVVDEKGTVTLK